MSAYNRVPTAILKAKLAERDGNMCCMCGMFFSSTLPPTVDHIKPRSKKGTGRWGNLQLLCERCNNRVKKGHSPIGIFLTQMGIRIMKNAKPGTDRCELWKKTKCYFSL